MPLRHALFLSDDAKQTFLHPTAQWQTVAGNDVSHQNGVNHLFFYDEEAKEFFDAVQDNDPVEMLDALGDMIFVAWGITHHLQLDEPMAASQMSILYVLEKMKLAEPQRVATEVFEEVVRSNFSKFCQTEEEAQTTVQHYADKLSVEVAYKPVEDFFIIYSTQDQKGSDGKDYRANKILKSVNFSEPNFSEIQL